ncbi:MAG: hypothetical protein NTX82_06865 [Candidatus Parcubacteria bacterium]|nr:hypothetical protein [Candidatus Parcubacteria bacterium]
MLNRKLFIVCLIILLVPLLTFFAPHQALALAPTVTITPNSGIATGAYTDYCVGWTDPDGYTAYDFGTNTGNEIIVAFDNNYDLSKLKISATDTKSEVVVYVGTSTCSGGTQRITSTQSTDDTRDKTVIYTGLIANYTIVVIQPTNTIAAGAMSIKFRSINDNANSLNCNAGADACSVVAPAIAGNYKIAVESLVANATPPDDIVWLQTDLAYIGNGNQVNITSTVDPTISFALSDNTCNLGTLTTDALQTCGYGATVATNAVNGYSGYIQQDQAFTNGTSTITSEVDDSKINGTGALAATYGEYGIGVNTTDTLDYFDANFTGVCTTNYDGLTNDLNANGLAADTTDYVFATSAVPVDGVTTGKTDFCHGVRIKFDTPPGSYTQTVTLTIVGNF